MNGRGFIEENDASRQELTRLVASLDAGSYGAAIGTGWTVATALCHLAFWDQRVLFLLREWERNGLVDASRLSPVAIEAINHAVNAVAQAVPGPAAGRLVLDSANAVDSYVAQVSDDYADRVIAAGWERYLRRSLHRREHLQKISTTVL